MIAIRSVAPADHAALLALWQRTPGIRLRAEDQYAPFVAYLQRNPGLSLLAERSGVLLGGVMVGHDGRRGYLHHLVVDQAWRGQGLARRLLDEARQRLAGEGIGKVHVFVLGAEAQAMAFWQAQADWLARDDIRVFSCEEPS